MSQPRQPDRDDFGLGATGRFPQGKIHPSDEGELRAAVGTVKGQVVIDFGKSVSWLSLPPDAARELAVLLIRRACKIDGAPFVFALNTGPER